MDQRVSFVTFAVRDLDRSRRFYVEGLGWSPVFEDGDEVVMFEAGPRLVVSLWRRSAFDAELGLKGGGGAVAGGVPPMTLAQCVKSRAEVDEVLALARRAGADPVTSAVDRVWGGYSGYFADPDGFRWEVAWNPGPLGQVVLPDVEVE